MGLREMALRLVSEWEGRRGVYDIGGVRLELSDPSSPGTLGAVVREIRKDEYHLDEIDFRPGDVVVDVGGHVGVFSTYLARRHPYVRVICFEPVPDNFAALRANLERNGVANVEARNEAVTADGRELEIAVHLSANSGGGSAQRRTLDVPGHRRYRVPSTTLDTVLASLPEGRCKLLKIDCEGSEHEILRATTGLAGVEYLRGEFHVNDHLRAQGHTIQALEAYCRQFIDAAKIRYTACEMAE